MSDMPERAPQNKRTNLSLSSLYLDPNNFRFIDAADYTEVSETDVRDPNVQKRTTAFLLGKNGENVRDLIESFRKNGFLPVDQIQVRSIDAGKYLVVEGNRRVACLKYLQERHEDKGYDLGKLDPEIFSKLPVVHYADASDTHHLILMGLKHISGNKKWPAINQARLIRTLHDKHQMLPDDVCKSVGIGRREFNETLSTLALIDIYRKSDYGDQFTSDKYSLFREVVRNQRIRVWLRWDDQARVAENTGNRDRLFSWISEEEVSSDDETEGDVIGSTQRVEAILVKSSHIRELSKIIDDEQALRNLDTTRNLAEATLSSEVLGKDKVKNALSIIGQEVNTVFNMSRLVTDVDRGEINQLAGKLQGILTLSEDGRRSLTGGRRQSYRRETATSQFSTLTIRQYRGLLGLRLPDLRRINILAGINNAGKSSALEAVKLACSLTVPEDLFTMMRNRAKLQSARVDMEWFSQQLFEASVEGVFDGENVQIVMSHEDQQVDDETFYLTSVCLQASFGQSKWSSQTHLFDRYPERTIGEAAALCRSVMSSPFTLLDADLVSECHSASLREGSKQKIMTFLKDHVDPGIQNIELNSDGRFTVVHDHINPNPDLTAFGDGVQRMFKIGLLFAGARNGVVLIDELENAIHASLIPRLAGLIHGLAVEFNVQVFFASHSKECIDAFVNSEAVPLSEVAGYAFVSREGRINSQHFPGEKLHRLVESIDFDLRGRVEA